MSMTTHTNSENDAVLLIFLHWSQCIAQKEHSLSVIVSHAAWSPPKHNLRMSLT